MEIKKQMHDLAAMLMALKAALLGSFSVKSYSQEGEDMILRRIFGCQAHGFYVDVGAHHPQRFSNTYYFYRLGWRGINIEPNPEAMRAFRMVRKRDINLQMGISDQADNLTYHFFDDPALNTFDRELVDSRLANTPYRVLGSCEIPVERLDDVLSRYLPPGTSIDFLSIDVEGLDFAVLRSNDWQKYRPKCVLVEALATTLEDVVDSELNRFMKSHGYELFAKTVNTLFFLQKSNGA